MHKAIADLCLIMLNKFFTPSEFDNNKGVIKICELAQRAEECARQAETAPSAVRDHYRQLEKYWLILAQHYLLTLEEAEGLMDGRSIAVSLPRRRRYLRMRGTKTAAISYLLGWRRKRRAEAAA